METLKQYEDLNEEVKAFSVSDWFLDKVFLITVPACLCLGLEAAVVWRSSLPFFLGYVLGAYAGLLAPPAVTAAILASPALLFKGKFKPTFALIFGILWLLAITSTAIGIFALRRRGF
jgi:hypothetical protein